MPDPNRKLDETPVPLGVIIDGGAKGADGQHYGGRCLNANGDVLATYEKDELNPGVDGFEWSDDKQRVVKKAAKAPSPAPTPVPKPPTPTPPAK